MMMLLLAACAGDPGVGLLPPLREDSAELFAEAGEPVLAYVGEPTPLSGLGPEGASFRWTFGDGSTSIPSSSPTTTHAWAAPGHYTAFLEATSPQGRTESDSVAVTVVWPPAAVAPRASASLAHDSTTDALWIALPDLGRVAVVDSEREVRHIAVCDRPRSVAVDGGQAVVACEDDLLVSIDTVTDALRLIELPWGSAPFGVVLTPSGDILATLQSTGELLRLAAGSDAVETTPLGPDPRGLAWTADAILVSRHRSPDDGGTWWRLDPETLELLGEHHLPRAPGPDSDTATRGVPTYLQRIAVRPDARVAVLPGLRANTDRGQFLEGSTLTHETTARADLRAVALVSDDEPLGTELDYAHFDDRDNAVAAAFSVHGDWLYALHQGAEAIDVLDAVTLARVSSIRGTGHAPDGLLVVGDTLYAHARLSRELVVWWLGDDPTVPIETARIDLLAGLDDPLEPDVLRGAILFHSAEDQRMTFSGYMACASCHLDGTHDARTWDFTDRGEGLRNTQSLAGRAGLGHGPLHRSANFDEVQDFEHDIRTAQAGSGLMNDADFEATEPPLGTPKAGLSDDLDALAAYVTSLDQVPRSPHRAPDGSLTAAGERGQELFLSLDTRCADCHPPPTYTDSGWLAPGVPRLHDVGTLTAASGGRLGEPLTGLDTPTLLGAWETAPYLHDGSIETVREVLGLAGDLHGRTSHLSSEQLDDLAAFVLQLE